MEVDFSDKIKELHKISCDSSISVEQLSEIVASILAQKTENHNENHENKVSLDQLKKVYYRGSNSYDLALRLGKTKGQWAMARVNMFLKMNKGGDVDDSYLIADKDILIDEVNACAGKDIYPFLDFSDIELNVACLDLIKAGIEKWDQDFHCEDILYSNKERNFLDKPFMLSDGSTKKFGVYVKDHRDNSVILVKFGEPNLEDEENKEARCEFHDLNCCSLAKEKTDPKYWACKMWSKKPVNKSVSSEAVEWDEEELVSEWGWNEDGFLDQDFFEDYDHLENIKNTVEEEDV